MDFSDALKELKKEKTIKREEWGDNEIYIAEEETVKRDKRNNKEISRQSSVQLKMLNIISGDSMSWMPSAKDILADDWIVTGVEE